MRGRYRIIISNSNVKYDFTIKRNITILKGDSATGKTTLVEMVSEFYESGTDSGIDLKCDRPCRTVGGRDWHMILASLHETIVFIDEDNAFLPTNEFAEAVRDSDNYYILVTREGLPNLPYSVEEIYGIRDSGKYAGLKPVFNEFYHIYNRTDTLKPFYPEQIIVEDSNAGFDFFRELSVDRNYSVISAGGKSNIFAEIQKQTVTDILIIADGAAFGSEMDRVMKLLGKNSKVVLYLPESFEWLILKSGVVKVKNLNDILDAPEDYLESRLYFSWERFFTSLLIKTTAGTYLNYSKNKLNSAYLHERNVSKVLAVMENIELK